MPLKKESTTAVIPASCFMFERGKGSAASHFGLQLFQLSQTLSATPAALAGNLTQIIQAIKI